MQIWYHVNQVSYIVHSMCISIAQNLINSLCEQEEVGILGNMLIYSPVELDEERNATVTASCLLPAASVC